MNRMGGEGVGCVISLIVRAITKVLKGHLGYSIKLKLNKHNIHCISIVEKLFEKNYVIKAVNQAQGSNLLYFLLRY